MRRLPAPVTVITTYSTTPIDMALLWPFMQNVERVCQERRAKSRPENKRARANTKRVMTPA